VAGAQVHVPRWARLCTLSFQEVEDAAHVMFRCPSYEKLWADFLLRSGLVGWVDQAARKVMRGERGPDGEEAVELEDGGRGDGKGKGQNGLCDF